MKSSLIELLKQIREDHTQAKLKAILMNLDDVIVAPRKVVK